MHHNEKTRFHEKTQKERFSHSEKLPMTWYKRSFGKDYLRIYSHRDQQEAKTHVDFATKVLNIKADQHVLDLGCGYGRHSLELAKKNIHVTGIDLSEHLLKIARENALKQKLDIHFLNNDMRDIPFTNKFDAVLSLFTSFGYFDSDEENGKVIKSAARSLKQHGLFFLDYLNIAYTLSTLVPRDSKEKDGFRLVQERSFNKQTFRIEKKISIRTEDETREYNESVRAYGIAEIGSFFGDAGLICTAVYGDYDGSAFSQNSPRLIMVGLKEG